MCERLCFTVEPLAFNFRGNMIETSKDYKVAIIGYGFVGKAYHGVFPEAVIYDEPDIVKHWTSVKAEANEKAKVFNETLKKGEKKQPMYEVDADKEVAEGRKQVNECDLAVICVPTDLKKDGKLDMSIVEDVINWLDTPLILIKSALQPGTVDRLVETTGKKIAVSVEMVGEGKYFIPFWKYPDPLEPIAHNFLIIGGEEETAKRCADFLWSRMSPDINIHLVSAVEAEVTKLMENTWGAMKVTFANTMYDVCELFGANYTKVLQAWGSDGRTEKMHMRVLPHKRGWKSKCYDKDVPALAKIDESGFIESLVRANRKHLKRNG